MSAIDGSLSGTASLRRGLGEGTIPVQTNIPTPSLRAGNGEYAVPESSAVAVQESPAYASAVNGRETVRARDSATAAATAAAEKREETQAREDQGDPLDQMLDGFNNTMELERRSLRFRINSETRDVQMVIVDPANKDKVIRTIPPDEMLKLAARMRDLSGLGAMVDESR